MRKKTPFSGGFSCFLFILKVDRFPLTEDTGLIYKDKGSWVFGATAVHMWTERPTVLPQAAPPMAQMQRMP